MKIVPFLDRSELVHFTTDTVMHNLAEGIFLVSVILFLFLGNLRSALIVVLTIPFALLFASICLDLDKVPANLLSLGALDFGMVVDGSVVVVENVLRHITTARQRERTLPEIIREAVQEVQRPVFFARAIIITAYLPIFTLAACRRPPLSPHGANRSLRPPRRPDLFVIDSSRPFSSAFRPEHEGMAQPDPRRYHQGLPAFA